MAKKTLIHLSDLHIGLRKRESDYTKKIITSISGSYQGVPIIITGDLTDSASKRQFKAARKLLDALAQTNPILSVPGNHDYAWKGNILRSDGWKNWVKYLGSPLGWGLAHEYWMGKDHDPKGIDGLGVWKDGQCAYFGIDSGDPLDKQIAARGYISSGLANALKESLAKHANKTRIAFLHHHPFTDGLFTKLKGSDRLIKALSGNCELLLFGHEHEYGIWRGTRGIPLIVSSHKSSETISGNCAVITTIEMDKVGTKDVTFNHNIEVI